MSTVMALCYVGLTVIAVVSACSMTLLAIVSVYEYAMAHRDFLKRFDVAHQDDENLCPHCQNVWESKEIIEDRNEEIRLLKGMIVSLRQSLSLVQSKYVAPEEFCPACEPPSSTSSPA